MQVLIIAAASSTVCEGRPTDGGERRNNGSLVQAAHTVVPQNIQSAAVAAQLNFTPSLQCVASYCNTSLT